MKLVDEWRLVLRKAWSIRLIIVAGIFSGLEVAVPYLQDYLPVSRGVFSMLAFFATGGAFVARLLAQKEADSGSEKT